MGRGWQTVLIFGLLIPITAIAAFLAWLVPSLWIVWLLAAMVGFMLLAGDLIERFGRHH